MAAIMVRFRWLLSLILVAGCLNPIASTRRAMPLSYVGDIELADPLVEDEWVKVPVAYHGGQWIENSAVVPLQIDSKIVGREIDITVITQIATYTPPAGGYQLILPADARGEYQVFYRDPNGTRHKLGPITITPPMSLEPSVAQ